MDSIDLITMIGNLSRSLMQVQAFLSGLAYLIGILCFVVGVIKLKQIGGRSSHEGAATPLVYMVGGAVLIYLPTSISVLANTTFGASNVLQYTRYNPYDIYSSMKVLIQTVGLIWFIRGCVLLIHASEPGEQHGPKGLAFLCAGVLAMHFENTVDYLNILMNKISALTLTVTTSQGY